MTTNPEVLRLAREVAASLRPYSHNSALILDGERDGIDIVQIAIAAIERTTILSRDFVNGALAPTGETHSIANGIERYDHLRQSEKDNSDAD